MSFRLVPKSVTLNDLEQRNDRYLRYFSEIGSFRGALRTNSSATAERPRDARVTSIRKTAKWNF